MTTLTMPPRTVDAEVLAARPTLRDDLQVSDRVWRGSRALYLVRDPVADRTHELGVREHFLLMRLDGSRSLAAIGREYERELGRPVTATGWQQLLRLAGSRGLLAGGTPVEAPAETASSSRWSGSLLAGEVALVRDGQQLTGRLLDGPLRPLRGLGARFGLPALIAVLVTMLTLLAADLPALLTELEVAASRPWTLAATVLVLWLSGALHEIGHGVVARAHGGTVRELGVSWRLPVLIPFCRVQDYRYLPTRAARLATAGVGCLVNLAFLMPFAVLWLAAPGSAARPFLAAVLIGGTVLGLVNLVPIAPLDGYVMLSHATGTVSLAAESQRYAVMAVPATLGGSRAQAQRESVSRYPRPLRRLYATYAVVAPLLVLGCALAAVLVLIAVIPEAAGPWRYAGPIAVAVLAVAGMAAGQRRR